jgi:hypothetical protein
VRQNPTAQILLKLFNHEVWNFAAGLFSENVQKTCQIFLDDFVKNGLFRSATIVLVLFCGRSRLKHGGKPRLAIRATASVARLFALMDDIVRVPGHSAQKTPLHGQDAGADHLPSMKVDDCCHLFI